jgi:CRISPR/Cas system-associated exonuclease Cas4 (RecB family)
VRVAFEDLSRGVVVSRDYDEAGLEEAMSLVRAAARELAAATEFPARPGPLCATCPYRTTCPSSSEA